MAEGTKYRPGGDAQAIQKVANDFYGSFRNMFEIHGWDLPGNKMMTSDPSLIVQTYGSIQRFEDLHEPSDIMSPMQAIYREPPNVWLTSFYGFRPEKWGFLGFTDEGRRRSFLDDSEPGALVVIYGAGKASKDLWGKVIGIQQCSHQIGHARQFMSPNEWNAKERNSENAGKWNFAVKATRAWRVTPESRLDVEAFAPEATATKAWQHIGARGVKLSRQEALRILKLDLQEVDVYGENPIIASAVGAAKEVLAPSKAGPVSQNPFVTKESEGPKHLYILRLLGDTEAFLGKPAHGRTIVKAGFSKSPQTRRDDHNRALPRCAFEWEVMYSGLASGFEAYPTSDHAKAGERKMQEILCRQPDGNSLGGEFFLADNALIEEAWQKGNITAKEYSK
ncbi:hypothetical protein [Devosia sp. Naph2]|uniref:hypothetical protein n=1 Tax=Devosia polycyclovorans TaxID=3345148 RepID=UPI0035D01E8E